MIGEVVDEVANKDGLLGGSFDVEAVATAAAAIFSRVRGDTRVFSCSSGGGGVLGGAGLGRSTTELDVVDLSLEELESLRFGISIAVRCT